MDSEVNCPAEFAYCLDVSAGIALERNTRAIRRYAKEAWIRCGPSDGGIPLGY